jgi:predicted N-acetyltransferase YhbS
MGIEGPRAAAREEFEGIVALADRVFRAGGERSMAADYPLLLNEGNLGGLRVFVDGGRPVAHVGMFICDIWLLGTRHHTCCIGAVCTEPDYRGQGLATRLMQDAALRAREAGVDLFLISGGRGLYRRMGYVDVGGYTTFTVARSGLPEEDAFRLRAWTAEDVPAMVRIHSAEPVRFARTPDDFLALLQTAKVVDVPGDTRVVCSKPGWPVAYLTYRLPGEDGPGRSRLAIEEVAGSRWAVLAALSRLRREYGVKEITLNCLDSDAEVRSAAAALGWAGERHGFHGTVGIVDPAAFWDACAPLFGERLGTDVSEVIGLRTDEGIGITLAGEESRLQGMGGFTELVFAPPERRPAVGAGLAPGSQLARVLDALFPLPLVDYGLNFI